MIGPCDGRSNAANRLFKVHSVRKTCHGDIPIVAIQPFENVPEIARNSENFVLDPYNERNYPQECLMTQDELKQLVAQAALDYIKPELQANAIIGVGTGSTANCFIDALAKYKDEFKGAVASSDATADRLRGHGIDVFDMNDVESLSVYVDGADEANRKLHLIKGGGAALTREKIVASISKKFVCIADESKAVETLGAFPLPVEVIPMARSAVARKIVALGGNPVYREGVVTDNGNVILDVHGLSITDAVSLESKLNNIVGVVTNGLFAARPADVLLLGTKDGVKTLTVINTSASSGEFF